MIRLRLHASRCGLLLAALGLLVLPGCRRRKGDDASKPRKKPEMAADTRDSKDGDAELLGRIRKFTGARTKIIWSECVNAKKPDPFSVDDEQCLKGLDTGDPRGERIILAEKGNYSRPLITHDGGTILYTRKDIGKKGSRYTFDLRIFRTDWDGARPVQIAEGYAVDTWRDPAGREWVCAVRDVPPQRERTFNAYSLVRFPLDDPKKIEVLWDQSPVSPDNIQFSRDGHACSALLPWPKAGALTFDGEPEPHKYSHGCWPSMAPDNSRVSWVFNGSHKSASFFADDGSRTWNVDFNNAPEFKNSEVYHPRWSNHPRIIVLTGPYLARRGGISSGGRTAQVHLARLSPELDKVEEFLQVDDNDRGDAFPAAWIEGAEKVDLAGFGKVPSKHDAAPSAWPVDSRSLAFLWSDRTSMNSFRGGDGKAHASQLEASGAARSGRFNELLLDGGSFKVSGDSETFAMSALKGGTDSAFEALVIPPSTDATIEPRVMLSMPGMVLAIQGRTLIANGKTAFDGMPTQPFHLAADRSGGSVRVFINGREIPGKPASVNLSARDAEAGIEFGGGWTGGLMRIAIYSRVLSDAEIRSSAALAADIAQKFPPAPPRVKLLAKLVDASPVPALADIEPYTGSLVVCIYEVEKVLAGDFKDSRVLVKHWGLLNRLPTKAFPRENGKSYEITIEPETGHPEMRGERVSDESGVFDLQPWLDVTSPQFAP